MQETVVLAISIGYRFLFFSAYNLSYLRKSPVLVLVVCVCPAMLYVAAYHCLGTKLFCSVVCVCVCVYVMQHLMLLLPGFFPAQMFAISCRFYVHQLSSLLLVDFTSINSAVHMCFLSVVRAHLARTLMEPVSKSDKM